jgi:thioredoxin-like negative regulator of GroEL
MNILFPAVLALLPKDLDVLRCYATALLQTGQYQTCLDVLASLPQQPATAVLERAYAHYRLNQLPQAQALLSAVPAAQKTKPIIHLEAQVVCVRSLASVCRPHHSSPQSACVCVCVLCFSVLPLGSVPQIGGAV